MKVFMFRDRYAEGRNNGRRLAIWPPPYLSIAMAVGVTLVACDNQTGDVTPSQRLNTAIERTEQTSRAAADKAADLGQQARGKVDAYLESPEGRKNAAAVEGAVADAGAAIKATVSDAGVTAAISAALARDTELSAIRIDVDTRAGAVVLSGPAPNEAAKTRATALAKKVNGAVSVDNRLVVSPPS